jgi:hypothetical protein
MSLLNLVGPKNGIERRVSRFSAICAKNQVLKLNINKVTVIRVTQQIARLYTNLKNPHTNKFCIVTPDREQ